MKYRTLIFCVVTLGTITAFTLPALAGMGTMNTESSSASHSNVMNATNTPLFTSSIVGKEVKGEQGANLGKIADLAVGPEGSISYAMVNHGGVIGMEAKHTPVPWSALRRENGEYALSISKAKFDKAPVLSKKEFRKLSDPQFEQHLYGYYGQQSPEGGTMNNMKAEPHGTHEKY